MSYANQNAVFVDSAEYGKGAFRLWISENNATESSEQFRFFVANGKKIELEGLNEFGFALVRRGVHSEIYNVETGLRLKSANTFDEAIKKAKEHIARDANYIREIFNSVIKRDGVLPPPPEKKIEAVRNPHISTRFRKDFNHALDFYDEGIAEFEKRIAEIEGFQDEYYVGQVSVYREKIAELQLTKDVLLTAQDDEVWVKEYGEYRRENGLRIDHLGVGFGITKEKGKFYVFELVSGTFLVLGFASLSQSVTRMVEIVKQISKGSKAVLQNHAANLAIEHGTTPYRDRRALKTA
jgi:hypothetical protein